MKKVLLVKYSEIGLKGRNRKEFEDILISNIKRSTGWDVSWRWGRILVNIDWEMEDLSKIEKVFGVQNFSKAFVVNLDMGDIEKAAIVVSKQEVESGKRTFKVKAKRSQKNFEYGVYDINSMVGARILREFPELHVDVHNPEFVVNVEVKESEAYVYSTKLKGPGGLPVGTGGRAILLLSGGIDSPVAGWYAMKRGVVISALSFTSPPYTGKDTKRKLTSLAEMLKEFSGGRNIHLYLCPLTPVLEFLKDKAPSRYLLILQRRSMMRIAERLARKIKASAIYTGESIGQVASQTIENIAAIEEATTLPVIRPLSGFDKFEIVKKAEEIGTYEISIKPQVDVCSMFVPKNPVTKAKLRVVKEIEEELFEKLEKLEEESFAMTEKVII